jgi:hypothetical protein
MRAAAAAEALKLSASALCVSCTSVFSAVSARVSWQFSLQQRVSTATVNAARTEQVIKSSQDHSFVISTT